MGKKIRKKIIFFGDSLTEGSIGVSYFNILKNKMPSSNLINFGRNGDSVIDLYFRIKRKKITEDFDLAFVWIGTNDLLLNINWKNNILRNLSLQKCSKDKNEFKCYYEKILNLIKDRIGKIYTVSTWFIGEDFENEWNVKLRELSELINNVSKYYSNVEYIDIQKIFINKFSNNNYSNYLPISNIGSFFDYFSLRNNEKADRASSKRGLKFTIDGAHLNSIGANIVADTFFEKLKEII